MRAYAFLFLPFWLLLSLVTVTALPALESDFAGTISIAETIAGEQTSGNDREELNHYAAVIEARLKQATEQLPSAPPMVATTLREDIGFYRAELEKIVVSRGGELILVTSSYRISRGRVLLTAQGVVYRIDRNRNTAQALLPDKTIQELELSPLPAIDASGAEPGPVLLGLPTQRFTRAFGGKTYQLFMAPGLPNICALSLIRGVTDNELFSGIATLPGMPLLVETRDGSIVRRIVTTELVAKELADADFAPWR